MSKQVSLMFFKFLAALFFALLICFVLASYFTKFHRLGYDVPPVIFILQEGDRKIGVIKGLAHSPWAHSHVVNVRVDLEGNRIRITRYYVLYHPTSDSIYVGPEVIIPQLPPGRLFEIEYWNGKVYDSLGKLFTGNAEKEMDWLPFGQI